MLNHCIYCGMTFHPGKWWWQEIETKTRQCMYCGKVTGMSNIKITAEVDGKQVPLQTISTKSFEAIKALEKSKEIPAPVARLANYNLNNGLRLLFKPTEEIILEVGKVYSLDLKSGRCKANWIAKEKEDEEIIRATYRNVKLL